MGNGQRVLLLGAHAWAVAEAGGGCYAPDQGSCLQEKGCRWFSYAADSSCQLCSSVYPEPWEITGCRSWTPFYFCHRIYHELLRTWGNSPTDIIFTDALQHFGILQGSGEVGNPNDKRWRCQVWCDSASPFGCKGHPRTMSEMRGVNYGGRFVPEPYLKLPGTPELFDNVKAPKEILGKKTEQVSLCDVGHQAPNAADRMALFLDANIRKEHFARMAKLGFNVVRLPLGYWNLIDLPGETTPNGLSPDRWRALQHIMPASHYWKWIDAVFQYAGEVGMQVLLDLHGAPGGQTGNAFTGCDTGQGHCYFDTEWNKHLAVQAVEKMAQTCQFYNQACYGVELLNEPSVDRVDLRPFLRDYYKDAIKAARKHLNMNVPLIIMEWTRMLHWWRRQEPFSYQEYGRVVFSTHMYNGFGVHTQKEVRHSFFGDMKAIELFTLHTNYEVIVSEYSLSGHGNGDPAKDSFDYHSLANWLVHEMNQRSLGSAVWNYDADITSRIWGPVAREDLGARPVSWNDIFQVGDYTRPSESTITLRGGESSDQQGELQGILQTSSWRSMIPLVAIAVSCAAAAVASLFCTSAGHQLVHSRLHAVQSPLTAEHLRLSTAGCLKACRPLRLASTGASPRGVSASSAE